jgi:hypothetical protein
VKSRLSVVNDENTVKARGFNHNWDKSGGNLITGRMAVGVQATGAWCRLLQGTGEVRVLMAIEKSKLGGPDEDESRDAKLGCGRIRSSEESAVMAAERRDSVIYTSVIEQPEMGGLDERRKIV